MALFQLIARLGLNTAGFETGLKRAESSATRFAKNVAGSVKGQLAAAFGAAAIAQMVRNTIEYSAEIKDMSNRLGVSTDFIQEQAFALKMAGAEIKDLIPIMQQLAKARAAALDDPKGKMAQRFRTFGVGDLSGAKLEDIYLRIGDAIQQAVNPQLILADALALMGDAGGSVIPAMRAGLRDAAKDAHALGQVIKSEIVDRLEEANDEIEILKGKLRTEQSKKVSAGSGFLDWVVRAWSVYRRGFTPATHGNPLLSLEDIHAEDVSKEAVRARKNKLRDMMLNFSPDFKSTNAPLSHVGSFSARPVDTRQQLRLMERIAQSTEQTATNTRQKTQDW